MSSTKNKMFKGVFWSAVERYSGTIMSLIVSMILARLLRPEDYGIVAIVLVIIGFLNIFSSMGIGPAIIQRDDLSKDDINNLFTMSIFIALILSSLLFISSWGIAWYYTNPQIVPICQLLSVSVFFTSLNLVPHALMSKNMRFKEMAKRTLVVQVVTGVISVGAALKGFGVYSLVISPILSSIITFVYFWKCYPVYISKHFSFEPFKKIWKFSSYLFAFDFFNYFAGNLDKLIIGKLMPLASLGYYEKSYRLMQMPLQNVSSVVSPVMQPIMSSFQNDYEVMATKYNRIIKFLATISFPLAVILIFNGHELVYLFFGSQWGAAVPSFQIFAIALPFQMILNTSGGIWTSSNATNYMFWTGMANTLITCMGYILGACIGNDVSYIALGWTCAAVVCFLNTYYFMYSKLFKVSFFKMLLALVFPMINALLLCGIYVLFNLYIECSNIILSFVSKIFIGFIVSVLFVQYSHQYNIFDHFKKLLRKKYV